MSGHEHFEGRFEVEKKFRNVQLADIRARLVQLAAQPFIVGGEETDIYYDHENGRLSQSNQAFVLRELRPSGRILIIS